MSKMNHEHRNRMQKVYDSRPSRPVGKRKARKGTRTSKNNTQSIQGHVGLKSKYDTKCADCAGPIKVGDLIWWEPEVKYVLHDKCFKELIRNT